MSLFGKDWQTQLATIGATLRDAGAGFNGGQGNSLQMLQQQRDAQANADAQQKQQKDAYDALQGAFGGAPQLPTAQPGAGPMDQIAGFAQGQRGPAIDPYSAILKATQAGIDTKPLLDYAQNQQKASQPNIVFQTAGDTVFALDKNTGKKVAAYQGDHWIAIPEGGELANTAMVGGSANAPPMMGGAPQTSSPQSPSPTSPPTVGSVAQRNNNPGNLRGGGNWQGMTGTDPNGFNIFDNSQDGQRAAAINLANQQKLHGINTLAGVIQKWAPASDNNNTAAYIAKVAQQTGIDPNQPIDLADPAIQAKILPAIFGVEGGGTPAMLPQNGGVQSSLHPPQGQAAPPQLPGIIQGPPKRQSQVMTTEQKTAAGLDPSVAYQQDPNGKITQIGNASSGLDNYVPVANGASGQSMLAALDPSTASQVRALADGRQAFPTGTALKSTYWQNMLGMVAQYDPNFDATNFNARNKTRAAFTSGKYAQNITSFNTALGHLEALDQSVGNLNNTGSSWINGPKNAIYGAISGDASAGLGDFNAKKEAVINELPRVFRGDSGAEADVKRWSNQINESKSPQALHAVTHALAGLINSRIDALSDTYTAGMGKASDAHEFISPKAKRVLSDFGVTDSYPDLQSAQPTSQPPMKVSAPKKKLIYNPQTGEFQ